MMISQGIFKMWSGARSTFNIFLVLQHSTTFFSQKYLCCIHNVYAGSASTLYCLREMYVLNLG